jgi:hypothetical protein
VDEDDFDRPARNSLKGPLLTFAAAAVFLGGILALHPWDSGRAAPPVLPAASIAKVEPAPPPPPPPPVTPVVAIAAKATPDTTHRRPSHGHGRRKKHAPKRR